jgi:uncharacterized lipoprotein YddW (UPF0748 family)
MMKKLLAAVLAAGLMLGMAGCGSVAEPVPSAAEEETEAYSMAPELPAIDATVSLSAAETKAAPAIKAATKAEEMRAVWISYLEMDWMLKGLSESQFTANVGKVFDNVKTYGLNTVIVQVRPFGDALYDSDYFPWSYTITGTEGKNPGFDPLAIMVREAKARSLQIEAWLNPYRVRAAGNKNALASTNQAKLWLDAGSSAARSYDGAISYNPASKEARALIANGAAEIVRNYDVDGIHIDDYFYPTTDAAFDSGSYGAYTKAGGKLALADWRRANVTALVKEMYTAIKAEDKDVRFGISPQGNMDNNYNAQYLDAADVIEKGYCDYILPQIYFGYNNDIQPYLKTLSAWNELVKGTEVRLLTGLGSYKIGGVDSYAGSGKNEWVNNQNLMSRMVSDARDMPNYGGFALYRYDSIFQPAADRKLAVQGENKNLRAILG